MLDPQRAGPCSGWTQDLGDSTEVLQQLVVGTNAYSARLAAAKAPVGSESLQREDGGAVMRLTQQIADKVRTSSGCGAEWAILNVLHRVASQVAALKLGYRARVAEVRGQIVEP